MSLDEAHQECLEVIVKECLGSIDDGGESFRSKQSSIMDVESINSDYLKSGLVYGDNDDEIDRHEVPNLSKSQRGTASTTKHRKK